MTSPDIIHFYTPFEWCTGPVKLYVNLDHSSLSLIDYTMYQKFTCHEDTTSAPYSPLLILHYPKFAWQHVKVFWLAYITPLLYTLLHFCYNHQRSFLYSLSYGYYSRPVPSVLYSRSHYYLHDNNSCCCGSAPIKFDVDNNLQAYLAEKYTGNLLA